MRSRTIHVDPVDVAVSRPDKPLFPDGITKSDLAGYYQAVADRMLPHVADRRLRPDRYRLPDADRWLTRECPWSGMPRRARRRDRVTGR